MVQSFEGQGVSFIVGREESDGLKALLSAELTLYMLLLGILNIFLYKLSGQEDIIVGSPIAGRIHPDLEPIIGMFVNTLVLRNSLSRQKTVKSFLEELKENTLEVFENQGYPFEELVEQVVSDRDVSRNPLFDVMFVLQNVEIPEIKIPHLTFKPYNYESKQAKFDLTLSVMESEEGLLFGLEYCTRLFKEKTILRFIHYFKKIIKAVNENPIQQISEIDILSEDEKHQLLIEFNNIQVGYPADKTIHHLFTEQIERNPNNIALYGPKLQITDKSSGFITYDELNNRANRLSFILMERGVTPGTVVGLSLERSVEMIIAIFGTLKSRSRLLTHRPGVSP